ncbi:MAG TPA: ornithine cyclodeaminase family protein [Vicinamibacterales bacterium]|nr:ornithine cyclodeaminase family protein [Vicinamibacterales bacterium]
MPILLSEQDVRAVLSMDDLIAAMEQALAQYSTGAARQPLRNVFEVGAHHAFHGVMPAFIEEPASLGTKIVTVYGSNPARGLPTHLATIVLLDPATGALRAVMDGRYITEARTAAASAASARHLARRDARVLAVIGSGVQAHSHIEAIVRVRPIEEVRVWGRTAANVERLVAELAPQIPATLAAARTIEDAVRDADVIALVTASRDPVLRREWVRRGAHICAVGACRPDQREMDTALVRDARVFVDSRIGALAEAGDIVIPLSEGAITDQHIAAELGQVIAGTAEGRPSADAITIFKSLGMAVEDVAAARLAWERAGARGIGREFEL